MTEEHPEGAILGADLRALRSSYSGSQPYKASGYYAVERYRKRLLIPGRKGLDGPHEFSCGGFSFSWDPSEAYYFRNYFLAWGYHQRLLKGISK